MVTYSRLTLKDVLCQSRITNANRPSLAFVGESPITYDELSIMVNNMSSILLMLGIEKGDRVAILGENSPNWGIAFLAVTCMGAVAVPIDTDYSNDQVGKAIEHSGSKAVFVSDRYFEKIQRKLQAIPFEVVLLNNLEVIEPSSYQVGASSLYARPQSSLNIDFASLCTPEPMEEDLAAIYYVCLGNRLKGVMLTHKNIISNSLSSFQVQDIVLTDRLLSVLPLSSAFECTIGFVMPLMHGASVYYLSKSPSLSLRKALKEVKPTVMLSTPTIIERIFHSQILPQFTSSVAKTKLYSNSLFRWIFHRIGARKLLRVFGGELKFMGIGGKGLSYEVEEFLYQGAFPYSVGYGTTEMSPLLTGCTPAAMKFRCAGFCLPGQEVRISNADENSGVGEIWARGANIMQGYFKDDALTSKVITADGWYKTGDFGILHPDGYLEIKAKSSDAHTDSTQISKEELQQSSVPVG